MGRHFSPSQQLQSLGAYSWFSAKGAFMTGFCSLVMALVSTYSIHQLMVGWHTISFLVCIIIHGMDSQQPDSLSPATPTRLASSHFWNLYGRPGGGYYAHVEVGTPPQKFNVLVDTGSSNFAIAGAQNEELDSYFEADNSSTFLDLGKNVMVTYSQGSWTGRLGQDLVSFPGVNGAASPLLTPVALITSSDNFYINNAEWQGIVGLAFSMLAEAEGKLRPWLDEVIIKNNLTNTFTLELCGPSLKNNPSAHVGRLTLGSSECELSSEAVSCSLRRKWFYEVVVTAMSVRGRPVSVPCITFNTEQSVVDSGTSDLRLPAEAFERVIAELILQTPSMIPPLPKEFWYRRDKVCWSKGDEPAWEKFPSLSIHLASDNQSTITITIGAESYIRPAHGTNTTLDCWVLGIGRSLSGTVLGAVILEGLCVTFDRAQGVIIFSKSTCGPSVTLQEMNNTVDMKSCMYTPRGIEGVTLASYIMGGILGLLSLPLVLAFLRWAWTAVCSVHVNSEVPFISLENEIRTLE